MGKANISFPEGMLEEVDRRAAQNGTSRSGFVQEATARYFAELDDDAARTQRTARIERAKRRMAEIGARLPSGPEGVTVIRGMRDAVPEWLAQRDSRER